MNKVICPKVLLISNRYDFSTDFISLELSKQKIPYIRINKDELCDYSIHFNPIIPEIVGKCENCHFLISPDNLKSIYYRAPTFLRDIFCNDATEEEQLKRTQWTAFVRSLCVFENAKWFNNPVYIYKAEIKSYQLFMANKLGMKIPKTIISNEIKDNDLDYLAIKSIDTAIVNIGQNEGFVYTEIYKKNELNKYKYSSPFFIQEGLIPKIDVRVTVIENNVIAFKIFGKQYINEDWRRYKNSLQYESFKLPNDTENFCIDYVKKLNLNFGAIDLILHNNEYYFIEINPTGEWAWLQQNSGVRIDSLIVERLTNG